MGTALTGTTPQDTYDSLIKVTDNGPISGTAKYLSDGLGNDSILALSTSVVGIGTASPQSTYKLTLSGTDTIFPAVFLDNTTNSKAYSIRATGTNFIIRDNTSSNDRVLIDTTGNVGIGTSAPAVKLDIVGSIRLDESGTSTDVLTLRSNFASVGPAVNVTTSSPLLLMTANTERVRITSTGVVELSQGQIKFPATQVASANANTLDDYEEGTWTMGVSFGGLSVGVTTSLNTGTYTKIGRQVTVNGIISLTSKGSSTGNATLTGLPFTIPNSASNYSPAIFWLYNVTFANQFQGYGQITGTQIFFHEITEAGVQTSLTDADFANNSEAMVSFTYFV